jgi:Protein of unknown function (DUF2892)
MIYTKNLPAAERVVRGFGGVALVACGLIGMKGLPIGYVLGGSGLFTVLTGFVGFCPMCALAGRRIAQKIKEKEDTK